MTGAAGLIGAGPTALLASSHADNAELDLDDPVKRVRLRAKMAGSVKQATIHGLAQLHLYGYLNDGNVVPLTTMWNYTVTKWRPVSETQFQMNHYESGIYTEFGTDKVIDHWENPVTGEKREVWPFIGGPIPGLLGPDGMETGEDATVKPVSFGIHVAGGHVHLPTRSSFKFPNPFSPDEWPKEAAGPMYFWDSFSTRSARVEDVLNPDLDSVPSILNFQNLVSWHPWFGMGDRGGRSFGQAYGNKLTGGFETLPEFLQAAVKKQTPEMLETDNWTEFRNDFADYMRMRKPT
jgi:hypothetical protein